MFCFTLLFVCVLHSLYACIHETVWGDSDMCMVQCMVGD